MAPEQMQATTVSDNVVFAYRDSGPPPGKSDYLTVIIVHGHTFHSGTFRSMVDMANLLGYRVIIPNRRLYPGSTPYTDDEITALQPTSPIEGFISMLERQGAYLLEFFDNMIKEHDLQKVALVGWSLGSMFLTLAVGAIKNAPEEKKRRLQTRVKAIISWDPANMMHGIAVPPTGGFVMPLYDQNLTPEERIQEFLVWVTAYFPHLDVSARDFSKLLFGVQPNTKRPSTFSNVSPLELSGIVEMSAGDKGDSTMGEEVFWPTTLRMTQNALFNQSIRNAWRNVPFSVIYGDQCVYTCIWAAWTMEEMAKQAGTQLNIRQIPGANHFPMVDDIPLLFESISCCVQGGTHSPPNLSKM